MPNTYSVKKIAVDLYQLKISRNTEIEQVYEFYLTEAELQQLIGHLENVAG